MSIVIHMVLLCCKTECGRSNKETEIVTAVCQVTKQSRLNVRIGKLKECDVHRRGCTGRGVHESKGDHTIASLSR